MRVLVFLFFLGLSFESLASMCTLKPDPNFPRKHDIRMPDGRLISIVGHRHPTRSSNLSFGEANLESLSNSYFKSMEDGNVEEGIGDDFKNRVFQTSIGKRLFNEMPKAAQHYRENYVLLKSLMKKNKYDVIGVEAVLPTRFGDDYLKYTNSMTNTDSIIKEVKRLVDTGAINKKQAKSVLSIQLSPGVYLSKTNPELMKGKKVLAFANARDKHTQKEEKAFCENHKPPIPKTDFPQSAIDSFFVKRYKDLPTEKHKDFIKQRLKIAFVQARKAKITTEMRFKGTDVKPEEILNEFIKVSGLNDLTEGERKAILANAQTYIDALNGPRCSLNDKKEIDAILAKKKSSIYFVGKLHLTAFKQYLESACREMRSKYRSTNSSKGQSGVQ